ncbi:MAG TPA: glycosyltransferase family 2 protein [Vicinamibacterales bacterium]
MKVCALIAAFNEATHIADVVGRVQRHLSDVVVVDDGSTDGTGAWARDAGAVVLRHDLNLGKGCAVRTGLAHVLAGDWTHVLLIDGDGQHDPDDIPRLLEIAERDACDVVITERAFKKAEMPTARFYSNRIGSRILSAFIGMDLADSQSGFRLVRTDAVRGVPLRATRYELETEMLIKLARRRASIARLAIPARYHGASSKLRSFRDTFRTCMLAVWYRYLSGD